MEGVNCASIVKECLFFSILVVCTHVSQARYMSICCKLSHNTRNIRIPLYEENGFIQAEFSVT